MPHAVLRFLPAVALAAVLTGCSDGAPQSQTPPPGSSPMAQQAAVPFNDADVAFARQALAHHQQGVDLASLAETRAENAELKALARRIIDTHEPEVARLSALIESWAQPAPDDPNLEHVQRDGYISPADLTTLAGLSGKDFDRQFVSRLQKQREAGVRIAEAETQHGRNPDARDLAATTARSQQQEISELRGFQQG
ncbi:DUF305 domain-containing protein [Amycolatopsis regifaucium]|uniref:DUF305 domain-containing protein n=1 Tax=Amycolatopsis regifaucium TaxID=546365 RepID=A0A154MJS8_9PSEU|nr:DUF305 domain-containing protein [Amycolatopsis regifaucium]KZB84658.1 DUF305 domain-containing protein [Amycolatopsis regifaucium]OKA11122.1 DUF305 domain-containing protein [Amycolatopsis regifaucium]SFI29296.1 Uncharacterized conserved protein, DUF305 family [Amycolatopsis regifaucium]